MKIKDGAYLVLEKLGGRATERELVDQYIEMFPDYAKNHNPTDKTSKEKIRGSISAVLIVNRSHEKIKIDKSVTPHEYYIIENTTKTNHINLSRIIYDLLYSFGKELHVKEIKNYIIENHLYDFGATEKNIESVISNTINRHCDNNDRTNKSKEVFFHKVGSNTFSILNGFKYIVITENDESIWEDTEGKSYHFPKRYKNILVAGSRIIYYKGIIKDKKYRDSRLTDKAHYFGHAFIKKITPDINSIKGDLFAEIVSYERFESPVIAKKHEGYYEKIPDSKKNNYWRDGVREISYDIYTDILHGINIKNKNYQEDIQNANIVEIEAGAISKKTKVFSSGKSSYERDPNMALNALSNANFKCENDESHVTFTSKKTGKQFVEAHHLIPMKYQDDFEVSIDVPENIISLCPNCHRAFHNSENTLKKILIKNFQKKRESLLLSREILIDSDSLLKMYKI